MTPDQIVERERSRALPGAVAAFGGIALIVIATIVRNSADLGSDEAELLRSFPDQRGTLLTASILQAAALLLLIMPLFFLFQSAGARSDRVRSSLLGITVAGPLFFGVGIIFQWVGFDAAASAAGPHETVDQARQLIRDQTASSISQGLQFAGLLGLVVAIVYTALQAMRVGLLTRFWGTLGMALGVMFVFFGPFALVIFFLVVGLLIAGFWPGGRPPAWDAGKAVPWPRPGDTPETTGGDEPALPPGAGSEDEAVEPGSTGGSTEAPRKRKQRRG